MENFVIATNLDGRTEAFYTEENGTVMHTWQIETGNKMLWSEPQALFGTRGGNNNPLSGVVRLSATTDVHGQIQVIACTRNNEYLICFQSPGCWNGWFPITQQNNS